MTDRYDVLAVPKVVVNGEPQFEGALPEGVFVARLLPAPR